MKISADDFWRLVPIALERLDDHFRRTWGFPLEMGVVRVPVSGFSHPIPGEQVRLVIKTSDDRYLPVDPVIAVLWLLTGEYLFVNLKTVDRVGLDRRFIKRVDLAIHQVPGYSRAVRRKLLDACKLDPKYLEPTTA